MLRCEIRCLLILFFTIMASTSSHGSINNDRLSLAIRNNLRLGTKKAGIDKLRCINHDTRNMSHRGRNVYPKLLSQSSSYVAERWVSCRPLLYVKNLSANELRDTHLHVILTSPNQIILGTIDLAALLHTRNIKG